MYALANRVQRPGSTLAAKPGASRAVVAAAVPRGALRIVAFREDDDVRSRARRNLQGGRQQVNKQARTLRNEGREAVQQGKKQLNNVPKRVITKGQRQSFEDEAERNAPTVYLANALALAVFASYTASSPLLAAGILFQPSFISGSAVNLLLPLMRILSLGYSAAAVTNYVQSAGAKEDELDSTLHKRLNASLSTFSVAQLLLLSLCLTPLSRGILGGESGTAVLNTAGVAVLSLGVLAQLYVAGVNYAKNSPEGYDPIKDINSWLRDAGNTFSGIDGINSAGYAVVTASLLAAGIGYLVLPYPTLVGVFGQSAATAGPQATVLWQLIGAGVSMIAGPIAYSLKEGASDNMLSDVRYKLLNIALLTAGVGHWLVLFPRVGDAATSGPLMPAVLGTWATAALLGSINLLQSPRASRR